MSPLTAVFVTVDEIIEFTRISKGQVQIFDTTFHDGFSVNFRKIEPDPVHREC
jgi:hypothetical protein